MMGCEDIYTWQCVHNSNDAYASFTWSTMSYNSDIAPTKNTMQDCNNKGLADCMESIQTLWGVRIYTHDNVFIILMMHMQASPDPPCPTTVILHQQKIPCKTATIRDLLIAWSPFGAYHVTRSRTVFRHVFREMCITTHIGWNTAGSMFQTHIPTWIPYLLYPLCKETTKRKFHFVMIYSSQITGNQLFPNVNSVCPSSLNW